MSKAKKMRKLRAKAHQQAIIVKSRRYKHARAKALYAEPQRPHFPHRHQLTDEEEYRDWIEHTVHNYRR